MAFTALKNIVNKEVLTKIDMKIISMLDNSILENIEKNADYLNDIEEIKDVNLNQTDSLI